MITHVVMMKLKDENKQNNLAETKARLQAMVGKVPSLRALEVGLHAAPVSERTYDLVLITRFDDLAGLAAYADHPFHVAVKDYLATVLASACVVDFEADRA